MRGELVGINTWGFRGKVVELERPETIEEENISFAIRVDTVLAFLREKLPSRYVPSIPAD